MKFREIAAGDVPELFYVRPRTRENTMTLEELQRLGITPQSVTESLDKSTKGWVCDDSNLRAYGFYRKRGWTDWKVERGLRWMERTFPNDRSGVPRIREA